MDSLNLTTDEIRRAHKAGIATDVYARRLTAGYRSAIVAAPANYLMQTGFRSLNPSTVVPTTMYAQYIGRATGQLLNYVSAISTVAATATASAICGFGKTDLAPAYGVNQRFTPLTRANVDITQTGRVRNATPMRFEPRVGEFLWAYFFAYTTGTGPSMWAIGGDNNSGMMQLRAVIDPSIVIVGTSMNMGLVASSLTFQMPIIFPSVS